MYRLIWENFRGRSVIKSRSRGQGFRRSISQALHERILYEKKIREKRGRGRGSELSHLM